jgi:hypothetical protein
MTLMRMIDPVTFASFKKWMSTQKDRDPLRRYQDLLQANAVRQLFDEGRLNSRFQAPV